LRLRLDYRLFLLGEVEEEEVGAIAPSRKHPQRIAAWAVFQVLTNKIAEADPLCVWEKLFGS